MTKRTKHRRKYHLQHGNWSSYCLCVWNNLHSFRCLWVDCSDSGKSVMLMHGGLKFSCIASHAEIMMAYDGAMLTCFLQSSQNHNVQELWKRLGSVSVFMCCFHVFMLSTYSWTRKGTWTGHHLEELSFNYIRVTDCSTVVVKILVSRHGPNMSQQRFGCLSLPNLLALAKNHVCNQNDHDYEAGADDHVSYQRHHDDYHA